MGLYPLKTCLVIIRVTYTCRQIGQKIDPLEVILRCREEPEEQQAQDETNGAARVRQN